MACLLSAERSIDMACDKVYVLYSRNKIILGIILAALAAEVSVMAVMLGITLPREEYRPDCLISRSPGIYVGFW